MPKPLSQPAPAEPADPLRAPSVTLVKPGSWRGWAGPVLILLAAAAASAPVLLHGVAGADDLEFHFISWLDAQHSWLHGIPYPHWATSPNFGAGEPRFVFYPPLTWMLGAALGLILPWTVVPVAMVFLMFAGTGLATRAFARQALSEGASTLAGCAAIFSGYALFTGYYRTAFGEMAGGFWIPLLLLYALRDRRPAATLLQRALDGSTLPLALMITGCWLCDAPLGVMGSYLLAGVAVTAALLARSWFPLLRAVVAVVLGIALTGAYLIPAAWEQRWVDIQQATGAKGDPGLKIENNWIFPHHTDPVLHQRDEVLFMTSPIAVSMIGIALLGLLALFLRRRLGGKTEALMAGRLGRRWWLPLALIPTVVLFLLLPVSLPLWNLLPKLRFLQFPWRWLLIVEAPMAALFAAAVWPGRTARNWQRVAVAATCALLFAGITNFAAQNFFRDSSEDEDLANILANYNKGAGFIGTDEYAPPGADNYLVPTGQPDACLADNFDTELGVEPTPNDTPSWRPEQGSCFGMAMASIHEPERMRVSLPVPRAGFVVLKLRSYGAWRVTLNGHVVAGLPARPDGLIAVPVSTGPADISVDWATTPDVVIGRCVSVLALLALVGLWFWERKMSEA